MKKILIICALFLLISCGASITDVKVGMTEAEVEELLGKANQWNSSSNSFTTNGVEETHSVSSWTYNGAGTIEFEDGVVVSIAEE